MTPSRFTLFDELLDHRELYLMLHLYRWLPVPLRFKCGISYSTKNRAKDVSADVKGYVIPVYRVRVRFAKFWEQVIHIILKCCLSWAPLKKGDGRTEFFWIYAFPVAFVLVILVEIIDTFLPFLLALGLLWLANEGIKH